jgi:fructose-1,6-bisphosphatase I
MMILKDFLTQAGTEKNLAELILFLSEQAGPVRKGFLTNCMNTSACGTRNMFGEDQKPLDKYADDVFVQGLIKSRLVR